MLSAIERFVLPASCLTCQRLITQTDDPVICPICRSRWRRVTPPWCARCGEPCLATLPCRLCTDWPDGFRAARSVYWLDDGLRRAIHGLKYDGFERLGRQVGAALAKPELPDLDLERAVIIPIPLAPRRQRERGYNQAAALARGLAAAWARPVHREVLQRSRETRSQTTLTPAQRVANVSAAFRVRTGYRAHHPVVLVDDVFTTGATLAEAAHSLLQAGVPAVFAVTLGRRAPRDFMKERKRWRFGLG